MLQFVDVTLRRGPRQLRSAEQINARIADLPPESVVVVMGHPVDQASALRYSDRPGAPSQADSRGDSGIQDPKGLIEVGSGIIRFHQQCGVVVGDVVSVNKECHIGSI